MSVLLAEAVIQLHQTAGLLPHRVTLVTTMQCRLKPLQGIEEKDMKMSSSQDQINFLCICKNEKKIPSQETLTETKEAATRIMQGYTYRS